MQLAIIFLFIVITKDSHVIVIYYQSLLIPFLRAKVDSLSHCDHTVCYSNVNMQIETDPLPEQGALKDIHRTKWI